MATVETHTETSQILIRQAEAELQDGDRLQASEKGWGAAAHALKAVAERRGWRHNSHGLLIGVADTLAGETGEPEIRRLFDVAAALHANFYETWMSDEGVAVRLEDVKELLGLLRPLQVRG